MADDVTDPRPAEAELSDNEAVKQDEVLDREGLEQELMQTDRSELGEEIEDVQDE